jgi:cell shape-determining protein MreC
VQHLWRELEIDAGSAQKLRVGMCLFAGTVALAGEVVEVRETSARVEFRTFETNSQRTSLKVGTELSTRAPKR